MEQWSIYLHLHLQVEFDAGVLQPEALVEAVEDCGFDASLLEVNSGRQDKVRAGEVEREVREAVICWSSVACQEVDALTML